MLPVLIFLFTVVPFVELYLLLQVGGAIGAGPTLLFVLLTGMLGAALARHQGVAVLRRLQQDLAAGRLPGDALMDGALVLVGAVLLISPGVLTDITGVLLLFPPSRVLFRLALARWARKRVRFSVGGFGPPPGTPQQARRAGPGDVIDVEAVVRDPGAAPATSEPAARPILEAQGRDAPGG